MVSLLAENFGNGVILEGNLNNINSNIKKIIQGFISDRIKTLFKIYNMDKNYHLETKNGDIFCSFHNSKEYVEILENRGFTKTENILTAKYNYVYSIKKKKYYKKNVNSFLEEIKLNDKNGVPNSYSYFTKENYIIFYSIYDNNTEYFMHLNDDYNIIDFKIDDKNFVYLILDFEGKRYFISTHLGEPFIPLNSENSTFDFKKTNFQIEIDPQIKKLVNIDNYVFTFLNDNDDVFEMEFEKRYYFIHENKLYFNFIESLEDYKNDFITVEQFEFLQIYNHLNIYGLNNFLIDNRFKISTNFLDIFKELCVNKFDNTLNGGLNFFNYKEYGLSKKFNYHENSRKDYSINYDSETIHINGNFFIDSKGEYKIIVYKEVAKLFKKIDKNWVFVKGIVFKGEEFYFCNLKFFIKTLVPEDYYEEINITNFDEYTFDSAFKRTKLEYIPNNSQTIDKIIENSDFKDIDIKNKNVSFDGYSLIFDNYYDYVAEKFIYNNTAIPVKHNESLSLNKIKMFNFNSVYEVKDNKLYFRNPGKLNYTTVERIKFDLINNKNYITDFWIKNQGKTLFFKNTEKGVSIINNKIEADYYVRLPLIKDYINFISKNYTDIYIEDNDDLSVELQYDSDILITDKFLQEPLFYKVYIETNTLDGFQLFDSSNKEIVYLSENFKNGFVIYFNTEENKKYYYNLGENKFNYIKPIKAFQNIEINYYFNENNIIKFSLPQKISSFKIKSLLYVNSPINLYLYNTLKGTTYRINMSSSDLNRKFDLDVEVDKIYIESNEKNNSFVFIEESGNSLLINNNINFFKQNRNDIIYISKNVHNINIDKIDFTKVKIGTKYNSVDGKLIETNNGNFYINKPFVNAIPIYSQNQYNHYTSELFISTMPNNDEFYNNNYKTIGSFYEFKNQNVTELVKTHNSKISIEEVKNV